MDKAPILKEGISEILIKQRKYRNIDFSAAMLAEMLGVSIWQLSRALKKEYGKSYSDLVWELRVKDAKKYLHNPNKKAWTVDEIGLLVGFANRQSFFSAFKKVAGMSPEEWRKGMQKAKEKPIKSG